MQIRAESPSPKYQHSNLNCDIDQQETMSLLRSIKDRFRLRKCTCEALKVKNFQILTILALRPFQFEKKKINKQRLQTLQGDVCCNKIKQLSF